MKKNRSKQIQVYVINLKRRPDRLQEVVKVIPPRWLSHAIFTTDWPGPVDGQLIQTEQDLQNAGISLFPNWEIPGSPNPYWSRPIKKGEIGCSFSHICVWRSALLAFNANPELKSVIVLEDDVFLEKDADKFFEAVLEEVDDDWDLIYLGRLPRFPDDETLPEPGKHLIRPQFSYCTYAYAVSRQGVSKLLNAKLETALIAADEFLPACYTPHPRRDVKKRFPPMLNAWAIHPSIAHHGNFSTSGTSERSGYSDTEDCKFFHPAMPIAPHKPSGIRRQRKKR